MTYDQDDGRNEPGREGEEVGGVLDGCRWTREEVESKSTLLRVRSIEGEVGLDGVWLVNLDESVRRWMDGERGEYRETWDGVRWNRFSLQVEHEYRYREV